MGRYSKALNVSKPILRVSSERITVEGVLRMFRYAIWRIVDGVWNGPRTRADARFYLGRKPQEDFCRLLVIMNADIERTLAGDFHFLRDVIATGWKSQASAHRPLLSRTRTLLVPNNHDIG